MRTKFLLVVITCIIVDSESTQVVNIGVVGEKCVKEGPFSKGKSPTECVIFCKALKCLNALMENGKCFCTKEECALNKRAISDASGIMYQSKQYFTTRMKPESFAFFVVVEK